MATVPTFDSTPRCGSCQLTDADATTAKDFSNFAPVASGTRVKEIRIHSGDTAPGGTYACQILVNDGTNSRILDTFTLTNTANKRQAIFRYDSLILPTGYTLQAVVKTALAAGATLDFLVEGADQT